MYSTVVDGPITSLGYTPTAMYQHLLTHDYGTWVNAESDNDHEFMYWYPLHKCDFPQCQHTHGFWYVKQSDNFYTLPEEHWRTDE